MAMTWTITLPCGHKLAITFDFLCYDVITCRECRRVHRISKKERNRIALSAGWDVKSVGKLRNNV